MLWETACVCAWARALLIHSHTERCWLGLVGIAIRFITGWFTGLCFTGLFELGLVVVALVLVVVVANCTCGAFFIAPPPHTYNEKYSCQLSFLPAMQSEICWARFSFGGSIPLFLPSSLSKQEGARAHARKTHTHFAIVSSLIALKFTSAQHLYNQIYSLICSHAISTK